MQPIVILINFMLGGYVLASYINICRHRDKLRNLGASISGKPQGLSRPVMG
jgi:hypothetical protein